MKRAVRTRRLSTAQARRYADIRRRVEKELPDIVRRHHERAVVGERLHDLLARLKATRKARGLSLADITALTGMDRSALSKLESGRRPNPTVDTLVRYADAVGKRIILTLTDASKN